MSSGKRSFTKDEKLKSTEPFEFADIEDTFTTDKGTMDWKWGVYDIHLEDCSAVDKETDTE